MYKVLEPQQSHQPLEEFGLESSSRRSSLVSGSTEHNVTPIIAPSTLNVNPGEVIVNISPGRDPLLQDLSHAAPLKPSLVVNNNHQSVKVSPATPSTGASCPARKSVVDMSRDSVSSLVGSPRRATNVLAENAVNVRDAAKWIGKAIVKLGQPETVMIVTKAQDQSLIVFTRELSRYLIKTPRPCSATGLTVYVESRYEHSVLFNYERMVEKDQDVKERLKFWSPQFCANYADTIDFIITIGGDGTVLYTAWLFQHTPVPPVIPFHLGSLGFLTLFNISDVRDVLERFIGCSSDGLRVNMRMRLCCTIWRHRHHFTTKGNSPVGRWSSRGYYALGCNNNSHDNLKDDIKSAGLRSDPGVLDDIHYMASSSEPDLSNLSDGGGSGAHCNKAVPVETFHILNDLVVDRGPSAFLSQLELYVDSKHLTTVQADGLVISTPTGSTAYSLSAGGSLVHPEVPSFLITPICPHTLSFRPMMLPDSVELKIQVPLDSRATAWASFDGRHRVELHKGDFITVTMSRLPMATVCMEDQSSDWFESLRRCLHWNERARQKGFPALSPHETVQRLSSSAAAAAEEESLSLEELASRIMTL